MVCLKHIITPLITIPSTMNISDMCDVSTLFAIRCVNRPYAIWYHHRWRGGGGGGVKVCRSRETHFLSDVDGEMEMDVMSCHVAL